MRRIDRLPASMLQCPLFGIIALFSTVPAVVAQPQVPADTCVECHSELDEDNLRQPVDLFEQDIHQKSGLSCVHCHGGDPTSSEIGESMDPARGYVGRPDSKAIGRFCGKCHSDLGYMRKYNPMVRVDQWTEYLNSVHGQKNQEGDTNTATCISCHGTHGIKAIADPSSPVYPTNVATTCAHCHSDAGIMDRYGLPTDQAEKYLGSVHAKNLMEKRDLSSPTCNDCHGNHGAAPPGISSVSFVCGQCHARQQKLFNDSPHRAAFEEVELAACMTCHENHAVEAPTDAMLGTGDEGVCGTCHLPGEKGYMVGAQMAQAVRGLDSNLRSAEDLLGQAERAGMEVSQSKFQLSQAREKLIEGRVLVHSIDAPRLLATINDGMHVAQSSLQGGVKALEELDFRRRGLLASLVFILLAALGLYLKIRRLDE